MIILILDYITLCVLIFAQIFEIREMKLLDLALIILVSLAVSIAKEGKDAKDKDHR